MYCYWTRSAIKINRRNSPIAIIYKYLIHFDQTLNKRIIFCTAPNYEVQDTELKTVTFGMNCTPYLDIRIFFKLAEDTESKFPLVAKIL